MSIYANGSRRNIAPTSFALTIIVLFLLLYLTVAKRGGMQGMNAGRGGRGGARGGGMSSL